MALPSSLLLIFVYLSLFLVGTSSSKMSIISNNKMNGMAARTDDEVQSMYRAWMAEYGKTYNAIGETERRFKIFKDNLRYIDEHNAIPGRKYELGLNQFADLTTDEFQKTYLGTRMDRQPVGVESDRYEPKVGDTLPKSIDWRQTGAVGPIKNQGACGSCWAFSAVASVEGINQMVTGKYISLSEQQLVDCSGPPNSGCNGGVVVYAFKYIIDKGGIDTEANYPYIEANGVCNTRTVNVVTIDGFERVPRYNENALKKAATYQPVSVSIDGNSSDFQLYKSGIFTGKCSERLNHGVNVVGYGTEKGQDYWIVRNSWGPRWGEQGYIRMARNVYSKAGLCGIAKDPSYPVKYGIKLGKEFESETFGKKCSA